MKDAPVYVADFETRNSKKDVARQATSVWLWDVCTVDENYTHETGATMQSFMQYLETIAPCTIYTHNLKFDGSFIIDWIMKHGYEYTEDRTLNSNQFTCLISADGQFYNIQFCLPSKSKKRKKLVEFPH